VKSTGDFELWTTGNILNASVTGVWNSDIAKRYQSAFLKQASSLCETPWAHIVYLDSWVLGTPEIEPIIQTLAGWCNENNLVAAAHVYSPNMLKEYQLNRMLAPGSIRFTLHHFSDVDTAIVWLDHEGFQAEYPKKVIAKRFA